MVRRIVRDLDLRADGVASRDARVARVEGRVVDALALCVLEPFAGEPVVAPAGLAGRAVGIVTAGLARDVGAFQFAGREAVFGCLLLGFCGEVRGVEEFVD